MAKKPGSRRQTASRLTSSKKTPPLPFYPIRCKEIFERKLWGGNAIRDFLGKKCPARTGESWEIADVGAISSRIINGPYRGKTLKDVITLFPKEVLGDDVYIRHKRLPLIVKFLHAEDRLSLQVHPTDEFVRAYEGDGAGKMEAWYVVSTTPEARIIRGVLPGTTEAEFRESLANGRIDDCINKLRVKEGEVVFIPPGTVHSAYGGLLLVEVQQASTWTYRFTDWNRKDLNGKPRELSVEKAMRAMDLQSIGVSKLKPTRLSGFPYNRQLLLKCAKFTMEKISLAGGKKVKEPMDPTRFKVFTVLSGSGDFLYGDDPKRPLKESFSRGQTFLFPAMMGGFQIRTAGSTEIIVSYPS